ncbi:MAG: OmpH family outer membrane protein [Pseudomonadota bacterium]
MKFTTIRNFAALILITSFVNLSLAQAAETAAVKTQNIAVVDLESVLKNCDAMKDAQAKISKKQSGFQKEIDKKQESLEKESKQVNSKKGVLSDDAFNKEQEKFSKKVDDLKELVTSRQEALKKASLDAISKINDKIKESVEEIRKEKNLDVILSSSSTVFYKDELDLSAEVTKKLNKKISKVEIK